MNLREYVTGMIVERIEAWKNSIALKEATLEQLPSVDLDDATYQISLRSLWEDYGEQHVKVIHTGSLQNGVEAAEARFKEINKRSDVQADYLAHLMVGNDMCYIPQKYYKTERMRKNGTVY